jgi:hypothetical protein
LPAVPRLHAVRVGNIVSDELPTCEVRPDGVEVVGEYGEVDILVLARLATEPGVDRPAAAETLCAREGGHNVREPGEWSRDTVAGGKATCRFRVLFALVAERRALTNVSSMILAWWRTITEPEIADGCEGRSV